MNLEFNEWVHCFTWHYLFCHLAIRCSHLKSISTYMYITNGKVDGSRQRIIPIKVRLAHERDIRKLMPNAKGLKNSQQYDMVYTSLDPTPRQQNYYKTIKLQLQERISNGEKNLRIRYTNNVFKIINLNLLSLKVYIVLIGRC